MSRTVLKALCVIAAIVLIAPGCTDKQDGPRVTVTINSPDDGEAITARVVNVFLESSGIEIVPADDNESTDRGHYHIFVDREPVDVGELIPTGPGVIHTADSGAVITGLSDGEHTIWAVLGDGKHQRITRAMDSVTITYKRSE